MPILNFQRRFVPKILAGTKVHTIRVIGKRKFRPGCPLYMQTGSRFKPELFSMHTCLRVREIFIFDYGVTIWNEDGLGFVRPALNAFAKADGFDSWVELLSFFEGKMDGLPYQLIQWAPAEWE